MPTYVFNYSTEGKNIDLAKLGQEAQNALLSKYPNATIQGPIKIDTPPPGSNRYVVHIRFSLPNPIKPSAPKSQPKPKLTPTEKLLVKSLTNNAKIVNVKDYGTSKLVTVRTKQGTKQINITYGKNNAIIARDLFSGETIDYTPKTGKGIFQSVDIVGGGESGLPHAFIKQTQSFTVKQSSNSLVLTPQKPKVNVELGQDAKGKAKVKVDKNQVTITYKVPAKVTQVNQASSIIGKYSPIKPPKVPTVDVLAPAPKQPKHVNYLVEDIKQAYKEGGVLGAIGEVMDLPFRFATTAYAKLVEKGAEGKLPSFNEIAKAVYYNRNDVGAQLASTTVGLLAFEGVTRLSEGIKAISEPKAVAGGSTKISIIETRFKLGRFTLPGKIIDKVHTEAIANMGDSVAMVSKTNKGWNWVTTIARKGPDEYSLKFTGDITGKFRVKVLGGIERAGKKVFYFGRAIEEGGSKVVDFEVAQAKLGAGFIERARAIDPEAIARTVQVASKPREVISFGKTLSPEAIALAYRYTNIAKTSLKLIGRISQLGLISSKLDRFKTIVTSRWLPKRSLLINRTTTRIALTQSKLLSRFRIRTVSKPFQIQTQLLKTIEVIKPRTTQRVKPIQTTNAITRATQKATQIAKSIAITKTITKTYTRSNNNQYTTQDIIRITGGLSRFNFRLPRLGFGGSISMFSRGFWMRRGKKKKVWNVIPDLFTVFGKGIKRVKNPKSIKAFNIWRVKLKL